MAHVGCYEYSFYLSRLETIEAMSFVQQITNRGPVAVILAVVVSVFFLVGAVEAATTISANINTGGTLTVSGAAYASSTLLVTGAVTTYGNGTFGDASSDVNLFTGTLQASTTALFTNGLTTYGGSTFGDASTDVNLFTGTLQASTTALFTSGFTNYGNLTMGNTSTTTVTFTSTGINFDSNTLVIDPGANRVGILTSGPNTAFEVVGTASSTNLVIGGGTSISRHLSATVSLDFPVIAGSSCQSLTITVTGAADGDTVAIGVPNALAAASTTLSFSGFVSSADTVTVRGCQVATTGTSDPAAATVRADVWKH